MEEFKQRLVSRRDTLGDQFLGAFRDHWKLEYDIVKQAGTASGVLLLGITAQTGVFFPEVRYALLAYAAFFLLVIAAIGSLVSMVKASEVLEGWRMVESESLTWMDQTLTKWLEPNWAMKHLAEASQGEDLKADLADSPHAKDAVTARIWYTRWRRLTFVALGSGGACFLGFAAANIGLC